MCEEDVLIWLDQIAKIDELLKAKDAERYQYMAAATKCTSNLDGMPRGGGGKSDKVGDNAVKLASLSEEKEALLKRKDAILKTLERLPTDEYGVLHRIYVRNMTQWEVACDMNYSTVSVWRIKKRAMRLLGKILSDLAKDEMKCN